MADTVLDVAAMAGAESALDVAFAALQQRRTSEQRLRASLAERRRVAHRGPLLDVLAAVEEGAESPLEARYLARVERTHGSPRGDRQHRTAGSGHRRDVSYPGFGVVVELDGEVWHRGERLRDRRRDNTHELLGELTLGYGWHDVALRACPVAGEVGSLLLRQGWSGSLRACGRTCTLQG